jgi:hypothetical protein
VLWLVTPHSYALALVGLGLVFSEICTPLTTRCLRAPLLYSTGLCKSCEITPPVFVVWPPPCTWGRQGPQHFSWKLDSEERGAIQEKLVGRHIGDPLAHGEGLRLSTELLDRKLGPCEGLQWGLGGSLRTSRYLNKATSVVDGSLHLYLIFSFHIYIAILVVCFTFPSLVDRLVDRIGT